MNLKKEVEDIEKRYDELPTELQVKYHRYKPFIWGMGNDSAFDFGLTLGYLFATERQKELDKGRIDEL